MLEDGSELDTEPVWFDDIDLDDVRHSRTYRFEHEEIVAFARQWDPLPVHLDEDAARGAGFPGITASGSHMLVVKQRLLHDFGLGPTVITSFGSDETRYHAPARPGDVVRLRFRWVEKRLSKSREGCGVARHSSELIREDGVVLLSIYENILIRCRPAAAD